jgi:hypothetical protein
MEFAGNPDLHRFLCPVEKERFSVMRRIIWVYLQLFLWKISGKTVGRFSEPDPAFGAAR